jgi:hypothetical protein
MRNIKFLLAFSMLSKANAAQVHEILKDIKSANDDTIKGLYKDFTEQIFGMIHNSDALKAKHPGLSDRNFSTAKRSVQRAFSSSAHFNIFLTENIEKMVLLLQSKATVGGQSDSKDREFNNLSINIIFQQGAAAAINLQEFITSLIMNYKNDPLQKLLKLYQEAIKSKNDVSHESILEALGSDPLAHSIHKAWWCRRDTVIIASNFLKLVASVLFLFGVNDSGSTQSPSSNKNLSFTSNPGTNVTINSNENNTSKIAELCQFINNCSQMLNYTNLIYNVILFNTTKLIFNITNVTETSSSTSSSNNSAPFPWYSVFYYTSVIFYSAVDLLLEFMCRVKKTTLLDALKKQANDLNALPTFKKEDSDNKKIHELLNAIITNYYSSPNGF